MAKNKFSVEISVFQGRTAPEKALLVGYGAIINALNLALPLPEILALISYKRKQYRTEGWKVYPSKAGFEDTLYQHLIFALK